MEVRAVNKFTGISAQKTRLIVDEMRGKQATDALAILQFLPKRWLARSRVLLPMQPRTLALRPMNSISVKSWRTKRQRANGDALVPAADSSPGCAARPISLLCLTSA